MSVCVVCNREMRGGTILTRIFSLTSLQYVGVAHSTCATKVQNRFLHNNSVKDFNDARFYLWVWHIKPKPKYDGDDFFARMLVADENHDMHLNHWQNGPLKMPSHRSGEIKRLYAVLQQEHAAWCASNPLRQEPAP